MEERFRKAIRGLAIAQVVLAAFLLGLEIVGFSVVPASDHDANGWHHVIALFFLTGIVGICGVLGILATLRFTTSSHYTEAIWTKRRTRQLLAYLGLNIVASIICGVTAIVNSFEILVLNSKLHLPPYPLAVDPQRLITLILSLVSYLLFFIVCVVAASLACATSCGRYSAAGHEASKTARTGSFFCQNQEGGVAAGDFLLKRDNAALITTSAAAKKSRSNHKVFDHIRTEIVSAHQNVAGTAEFGLADAVRSASRPNSSGLQAQPSAPSFDDSPPPSPSIIDKTSSGFGSLERKDGKEDAEFFYDRPPSRSPVPVMETAGSDPVDKTPVDDENNLTVIDSAAAQGTSEIDSNPYY